MDNQCFRTDRAEQDTAPVRAKSMKSHAPSAATKALFLSSLWMASRYFAAIASAKSARRAVEAEDMAEVAVAADSKLESPNKTDPLGSVLFWFFLLQYHHLLCDI